MMHRGAAGPTIALPQWYASFIGDAARGAVAAARAPDTVAIGPLTVFRPAEGCDVVAFGPSDHESVVMFEGYLFDREETAVELGLDRLVPPAELVAAGYRRWGIDILEKLQGRYLLAIWDAASGRFFLGHDALGRHPVFYAVEGGAIWFSSNVLALAAGGQVPRRPNRLSLALGVLRYWPEAGQTFFESINRLRPGHYLVVKPAGGVQERKYWSAVPDDDEPWLPDDQVLQAFEPELERAVARCMKLSPQGVMLSGGIDSVTVAGLATDYARGHDLPALVAFSGRSGGVLDYEERMQSAAADALAMRHVVSTIPERLAGRDGVGLSLDGAHELPSPTTVWWTGTYRLFYQQAAHEGLSVLLTGSGGDDWLGVADTYAADVLGGLRFVELVRLLKADVSTRGASIGGSIHRLLWKRGLRLHVDSTWARLAPAHKQVYHRRRWEERLPSWLCPDPPLKALLVHHLLQRRLPALTPSGTRPGSYYRHALHSADNLYLHHDFETAYHVESLCGVRLLSPYHDQRLVWFLNRASPRTLLHGNRYKGLLRPVAQRRLPQLDLANQRKEYPRDGQERSRIALQRSMAGAWRDHRFDTLHRLGIVDRSLPTHGPDEGRAEGVDRLAERFFLMSAERWTAFHASS